MSCLLLTILDDRKDISPIEPQQIDADCYVYNIFNPKEFTLEPNQKFIVETGIQVTVPFGHIAQVCLHSDIDNIFCQSKVFASTNDRCDIVMSMYNLPVGSTQVFERGVSLFQLILTQVQTNQYVSCVVQKKLVDKNQAQFLALIKSEPFMDGVHEISTKSVIHLLSVFRCFELRKYW